MDAELKKMVGQMMMVGFHSLEMDEQVKRVLADFQVGNYIYFSRNINNAAQVAKLSRSLNEAVYESLGISPFISADQEGGGVSRIIEGAALIPGAAAVAAYAAPAAEEAAAATSSPDGASSRYPSVQQLGCNMGQILRSVGVNMNLAPDMDVNIEPANPVIGCRSYGDDPEKVANLAISMMKGLKEGGVLPVLKHFPGHGNVNSDSHLGIPENHTDRETLLATEFRPFEKGVQAGAQAILTAHVRYQKVDPENPATLSKTIVTDLLRKQYGFDGLILTDCLEMDAVRAAYGCGEGAVRAIEAGVDLLTISHTYEAAAEAAQAIYAALESGRLSRERIEASYNRIMRMKEQMGLLAPQQVDEVAAAACIMEADKLLLCRQIAAGSITLLTGEVKINAERPNFLVIAPDSQASTGAEDMRTVSLVDRAAKRFGCLGMKMPLNGGAEEAVAMVASAVKMGFEHIILGLYNARFRPGQIAILRELEKMAGVHLTVILLGAPYDLPLIERADGVLTCYEYTALSVEALLDSLTDGKFPGRCPMKLS